MNKDKNEEKSNTESEKILDVRSFDEINDLIQDHPHDIIVIKFYSEKCRFCRDYAAIYEQFNKFIINFCSNTKSTVKIITVNPNSELSLQFHNNRDEFWKIEG